MLLQHCAPLACLLGLAAASCSVSSPDPKADADDPANYQPDCVAALERQVRIEFEAALQYLLMAAHFEQVRLPLTGSKRSRNILIIQRSDLKIHIFL